MKEIQNNRRFSVGYTLEDHAILRKRPEFVGQFLPVTMRSIPKPTSKMIVNWKEENGFLIPVITYKFATCTK